MSFYQFTQWLENTDGSTALRESILLYPIVETTHVLMLTLFLGLLTLMDLRLVGWTMRDVLVSEFVRRLLPWALVGFGLSAVTGVLLLYSSPVRIAHNIFFRYKLIALGLAGGNALAFHTGIYRKVEDWDREPVIPRAAKIAGAISLTLWITIVIAGRMIAYNWFDCDKPQPAIVEALAGCTDEYRQH